MRPTDSIKAGVRVTTEGAGEVGVYSDPRGHASLAPEGFWDKCGMNTGMAKPLLAADDGIFALADGALWIWAHTCPTPQCTCRTAVIIASDAGRDTLKARGACVRHAWETGADYEVAARELSGLPAFTLDIDAAQPLAPDGESLLDLAAHPQIRALAEAIDGEVLDAIASLWHRGKGRRDPRAVPLAKSLVMPQWKPGDMLSWNEVYPGARRDIYVLDTELYEAVDFYCPTPECACDDVGIYFKPLTLPDHASPGHVRARLAGPHEMRAEGNGEARLNALWDAFRRRHPHHLERFRRRHADMKAVGSRLVARKIGRNEPCPCGSGQKYKKCCGS